ncbi:raffinose/stachyose/melibiose transport system permease protein [Pseudarthrobacter sp. W1I19]|uniref:carbohydrate ABC transporter permease n=1 Tax=Pseudarthrobacter sp. W1I19 TaxID=3042288 RepID=UPI0027883EA5|nr:carbohydrate ABC transporter permease [Pseudarthrobacter sp. W1I19]MDQ0923886.1 raffinose/stachyose/melibiose transport system permease protein [Pseudarthrobacter sp. W1I19]
MTVLTAPRVKARRPLRSVLVFLVLMLALCAVIFPTALMLLTSLKSQAEVYANPVALPGELQWGNFARAWTVGDVPLRARNSLVVTIASVLLSSIVGAGAGYVCARIKPRRLGILLTGLFAFGLFIPVQSGLVPLFVEMQALGLLGTVLPMIIVNAALQLPLSVVIFAAFFAALPMEVEESASIDGAGRLRTLFAIVMPLARPAVATNIILGTVTVWNDYFVSLLFSTDPSIQTLPVGLASFKVAYTTDWPATLAYTSMVALPVFILYIFLQRYITEGVTAGSVK